MTADWLRDAVLYEIYPQSFADSNGDGIGDLRGVIEHLDHVASLGVDAIWFNPCFESPFVDAGYDVSDYLRIAPRYGTNDDLVELVEAARERGIRVILDLVAGHTSDQHAWFRRELAADGPDPDGDRYVWCDEPPPHGWGSDIPGTPAWVASPGPRKGYYLKNFYDEQPALNFGWTSLRDDEPWRDPVDAPGPRRNREALRQIIDFWLSKGVSGFRVDMAFSLVKSYDAEEGHAASTEVWREIRDWMEQAHPDAVLIPEGTEPRTGPLAFDADFALVIHEAHGSLFDNRGAGVLPFHPPHEPFFEESGKGSTQVFLDAWREAREADPDRPVVLATADHDYTRLRSGTRTTEQLGAALTFLFTWGSIPCLYYGDEIAHALPARHARRRGRGVQPVLQPGRLSHPDAVGRRPERRLLHRRPRPALPPGRPRPRPADRRRAGGRPGLDPAPGPRADRAAPADACAAGAGVHPGAPRGLPVRLRARRDPPGRGQPAARAGRPGRRRGGRGRAGLGLGGHRDGRAGWRWPGSGTACWSCGAAEPEVAPGRGGHGRLVKRLARTSRARGRRPPRGRRR